MTHPPNPPPSNSGTKNWPLQNAPARVGSTLLIERHEADPEEPKILLAAPTPPRAGEAPPSGRELEASVLATA